MKIAILGAGAIGSMLGMFLQEGGADIRLVDPFAEHMDKIASEGLILHSVSGEDKQVKMETYHSADECGKVDLIILMTSGLFSRTALSMASAMIGSDTLICSCQNGFGQEDAIKEFFSDDKILQGVLGFSSVLVAPGEIRGNINRNPGKVHIYLGPMDMEKGPKEVAKTLVEYAKAGSLVAEYAEDIRPHIWAKAANNCACNALCAVTRLTLEQVYEVPAGKHLHNEILRELCEVGNAKGVPMDFDKILKSFEDITYPGVCKHYPSTAQDMFKRKKTEIDFLNGAIARYGKEVGVSTPYNDMVTCLCKIIEGNFDNQYPIN